MNKNSRFGRYVAKAAGAVDRTKEGVKRMVDSSDLPKRGRDVSDRYHRIVDPIVDHVKELEPIEHLEAVGKSAESLYGDWRSAIKSNFAPESLQGLLKVTRTELTRISACIMQISAGDAEKLAGQFGTAVIANVAGASAAAGILGLVGTFGTASTGTAIAALHGAAASSATLAWVGALVGGGMFAGAVVTGGVSVAFGLTVYALIGSKHRPFESLSESEKRIVQSCWLMLGIIDEIQANECKSFDVTLASTLLNNILIPLNQELIDEATEICSHLDVKHRVIFRQHILLDFQHLVIEGFKSATSS